MPRDFEPDLKPVVVSHPLERGECRHGYDRGYGCYDCQWRTHIASNEYSWPEAKDLPPYEAIPKPPWEELTVAGQRDELLSLAGLLIEAMMSVDLHRYPLLQNMVREAGHRYGPWVR